MNLLEEETKHLNYNASDSSFEPLIKPIKINSPHKFFIGDDDERTFRLHEVMLASRTPNKFDFD